MIKSIFLGTLIFYPLFPAPALASTYVRGLSLRVLHFLVVTVQSAQRLYFGTNCCHYHKYCIAYLFDRKNTL